MSISDTAKSKAPQGSLFSREFTIKRVQDLPLPRATLLEHPPWFFTETNPAIGELAARHRSSPVCAPVTPHAELIEAGKNTYTYDAHTYHTKVPPYGIMELMKFYLPKKGLVLDPFCGSGMTGVAARLLGNDCILVDLSPAATFIASNFSDDLDPKLFQGMWEEILEEVHPTNLELYGTNCRECGRLVPALYFTWAYDLQCPKCAQRFNTWDVARYVAATVKESKIRTLIECPSCGFKGRKRVFIRLKPRIVEVGYECCGSRRVEKKHPPSKDDLKLSEKIEENRQNIPYWYPTDPLPPGVNLNQPRKHGLRSVDEFYSARNLSALAQLWDISCHITEPVLRRFALFTLTSLYQRVTRLAEFRFWGGSGNMARFNVPFIFTELNVYAATKRKVNTIAWHLDAIHGSYRGDIRISTQSSTSLANIPSECVDFIFTDPPFGANINYSEMNILWESWLGSRTNPEEEAVINRCQGKNARDYGELMKRAFSESFRVLKPGCWMALLFHNSSAEVWKELRNGVIRSGFEIRAMQLFDKKHGTFKQFVSENVVGYDLVLHCWKPSLGAPAETSKTVFSSLGTFLSKKDLTKYTKVYLHVRREPEIDYQKLFSEWLATTVAHKPERIMDFSSFREAVSSYMEEKGLKS